MHQKKRGKQMSGEVIRKERKSESTVNPSWSQMVTALIHSDSSSPRHTLAHLPQNAHAVSIYIYICVFLSHTPTRSTLCKSRVCRKVLHVSLPRKSFSISFCEPTWSSLHSIICEPTQKMRLAKEHFIHCFFIYKKTGLKKKEI